MRRNRRNKRINLIRFFMVFAVVLVLLFGFIVLFTEDDENIYADAIIFTEKMMMEEIFNSCLHNHYISTTLINRNANKFYVNLTDNSEKIIDIKDEVKYCLGEFLRILRIESDRGTFLVKEELLSRDILLKFISEENVLIDSELISIK